LEEIIKYLEDEFHKEIYITVDGCNLINHLQEMITRERIVINEERSIFVPGCQLYFVKDESINAFTSKIGQEYCIFVNKGIIEEQKSYLEGLDWSFISDTKQRKAYIESIIEYGFFFIVFHEYAHVFCGHVDAGLRKATEKKAQEYEADIFSMDYLVKYIEFYSNTDDCTEELEKLFLAVYFLLERMQKQNGAEYYSNRLIQNYYDDDRSAMRSHPLDAQRIIYLYEMLNIVIVTDKIQMSPVKENFLEKLRIIKQLADVELPKRDMDYLIVNESIQELKKSIWDIREKIPRIGNDKRKIDTEKNSPIAN